MVELVEEYVMFFEKERYAGEKIISLNIEPSILNIYWVMGFVENRYYWINNISFISNDIEVIAII